MVVKGERIAAWTLLVLSACIFIPSPRPLRADVLPCSGTRLKLSVQERGRSAVERFRFSLAVSGEGADEATALQQLNRRLAIVRRELKPLVQGQLVVPAPHTHKRGRASEQRYVANTGVSGHVSLGSYDRLIQAVGAMPGVRLQGMESVAAPEKEAALRQRLMTDALNQGQADAATTARAIGRSEVTLLSIDRAGAMGRPRPLRMEAVATGFDPMEAPEPTITLRLQLEYCLS
ncbi:MAG: DUF541 domain-containing protein [Synechococcus sp. YX04-3]|nr:MAG: DUF541 domain-containing protein [Synechococcus sp. YX04-3]